MPLILKGSAKLEKAEILQMTVDHLKMLQATGGKGKELIFALFLILAGETIANAPFDENRAGIGSSRLKEGEINAEGRAELVGKNSWDKRSTLTLGLCLLS